MVSRLRGLLQHSPHLPMGIVNITPDSFSDGGQCNHREGLQGRLAQLHHLPLVDMGAESTAPASLPIGCHLEYQRFRQLENPHLCTGQLISIDTYRGTTFRLLQDRSPLPLIWNDVSGQLDSELLSVLRQFPRSPYIFCHNLAPRREQSSHHRSFVFRGHPDAFWAHLRQYFYRVQEFWQQHKLSNDLIFDLAFGFSKTYKQNWQLIDQLAEFLAHFPLGQCWVVGLSRKSFLRQRAVELGTTHEQLHRKIIRRIQRECKGHCLIFRVHDGEIFSSNQGDSAG